MVDRIFAMAIVLEVWYVYYGGSWFCLFWYVLWCIVVLPKCGMVDRGFAMAIVLEVWYVCYGGS